MADEPMVERLAERAEGEKDDWRTTSDYQQQNFRAMKARALDAEAQLVEKTDVLQHWGERCVAAERTVREQRKANGLLRSALYVCRRAMQAAGLTQTEVARREVYEWLKAEGDERAAAEWYESALAALAPNTEGDEN